uniref:Opioid growth factor receptor (OGFr) conserved domain-containing protein n=1 Tax=Sus scrofa TaxID=9823 RepID=A0A8D1V7J9_PIG
WSHAPLGCLWGEEEGDLPPPEEGGVYCGASRTLPPRAPSVPARPTLPSVGSALSRQQGPTLQTALEKARVWRVRNPSCEAPGFGVDARERGRGVAAAPLTCSVPARLAGCFIEDLLKNWKEDYDLLEDNHTYIQWLFPLREPGVNWHAKPLTLQEVEAFKSSPEVKERLVRAYELMLGFYGIQLKDRKTGRVCRAQNYQKRFQNLNWHSHNNLRITRMLKSLGELGLEHFQVPLTRFFLEETLVRRELPGVRQSALDYFVFTVRCRHQRRELLYFAWEHFRPRCRFVWAPLEKLQKFRPCSPPCSPRTGPRWAAKREKGPQDPVLEASAPGQTCGPGRGEEGDRDSGLAHPVAPVGGVLSRPLWGSGSGGEAGSRSKKQTLAATLREGLWASSGDLGTPRLGGE